MERIVENERMVAWSAAASAQGHRIGLVPTMGALHAGHTSLIQTLRNQVDRLVVSVFVNPLQFDETHDLDRYPRTLDADEQRCRDAGADVVFAPQSFYPDGFQTSISVHEVAARWEGEHRLGHFQGVATVCARLFGVTGCHAAVFGEKDFQQLAVVRRLVADLHLPVVVVAAPTARESDGLAMSSRNRFLSPAGRLRAASVSAALFHAQALAAQGEADVHTLVEQGAKKLDVDAVDYFEVVDALHLTPMQRLSATPARAIIAARIAQTRLIDNVAIGGDGPWT